MSTTTTPSQSLTSDLTVRIKSKCDIARGIVQFDLIPASGNSLPAFTAGAHIGVRVPNGLLRKYSLFSATDDLSHYSIAVKREEKGTGGSRSLIDHTAIGDELSITPPVNDFPLATHAASSLLIAGGIGITPLYSMFHEIKYHGNGRVKLIYLTRDQASTAFYDELSSPQYKSDVTIHHDNGHPDEAFDLWPPLEKPMGRHLYCCGPRPLMDAVRDMSGHWPSSNVHFEDFGTTSAAHHRDDRPLTVHLTHSHKTITVPANVTILDAVRAHGIHVSSSCESGSCGSCKTRLISGEADHRDLVLAPHEQNDYIIPCVSRAKSDAIEIDL
jgi:phthalate 4,5-dioxygenase reductase subunit